MKKICLVCDVPNWAFDIIAKKISEELKNDFEIDIKYFDVRESSENFFEFLEEVKSYDMIHFFWRKILLQIESETFKNKVVKKYGDYDKYIEEISQKISTGVYDFLFLKDEEIDTFKNVFNKYSKSYYVISKKLFDKYSNIQAYKPAYGIVHDVCNTSKMTPKNLERFDEYNRPLVVGWVGNSVIKYDGVDLKGFHSLIKPVIQELIEEGYNITEHYADRNLKWRTPEEMPDYYNEIDVCLCTSIMEGTPLPILEAMSCGIPIISTDVGVVPEALGEKQSSYIIGDREYGKNDEKIRKILKQKLIEVYENRKVLKELSKENLESIQKYDGGKIVLEYKKYFEKFLED